MKDDKLYLIHILESVGRIEEYTTGGEQSFMQDHKTQDAVLRNLQTLGQSVKNLSEELKMHYPDVPWGLIAGFRNVLVHDYLGINMERVWNIVKDDLSDFKRKIQLILKDKE